MSLPIWDDIDAGLDAFGVPALYTDGNGAQSNITVIFDREFSVSNFDGVGFQNANVTAQAKTSALGSCTTASTLKIDGTQYRVLEIHPSGTGMTMLVLSKV